MPIPSLLFLAATQGTYHPPVQKVTSEIRTKVIAEIADELDKKGFAMDFDASAWKNIAEGHSGDINAAETPDALSQAITLALFDMGSSHMALYAKRTLRHEKIPGIGIVGTSANGLTYVYRVFRNSAAERAGVRAGDRLVSYANLGATDPKGKPAVLNVQTAGGPVRKLTIRPSVFEFDIRPSLTPVSKKTAVLEIPSFTDSYYSKEVEALIRKAASYENLLIDLRTNGGGRPEWLLHLLACFEPKGTVVGTFIGKDEADKYQAEHGQPSRNLNELAKYASKDLQLVVPDSKVKYKGRIAVLIGAGTGSASEIVVQSLRESLNAPLIGAATAGAVLLPGGGYLPSGYLFEYPMYDYLSARGRRLENYPIQPDMNTEDKTTGWPGHPDPVWKQAENYLSSLRS